MKVAINTRFLLPQLEGIGTFTDEICKRLVQQNLDVEFHFLFDRKYDEKYIYGDNVTPHVLFPPARHPILWKIWYDYMVPQYLRRIQPDVFFSPDNFCSLNTDVPTMMVTHDLAFEHYPEHIRKSHLKYFKAHSKKNHQRVQSVACVSKFTQKDIIEKYQISANKTFVIYNGCSKKFRVLSDEEKTVIKENICRGKDFILYIGALHPRKNVARLIKAFEKFKAETLSEIKLVLIGRMAWKTKSLRTQIKNSTVKEDIIQLGHIDNVSDILSSATVLCYPSLFEGFGIPILEAFHARIPVLTSNISSMPEVAGNAAMLIDPYNIDEIANGIKSLISNHELRKDFILKGDQRKQAFSWDQSAQRIMKALREIS